MGGMPVYPLRQVLATLVESMTADMRTREVRIVLGVPSIALADAETPIETLSLRQTSASSTLSQDQEGVILAIARITCTLERGQRHVPCFLCIHRFKSGIISAT
jgi:hypothetical protein